MVPGGKPPIDIVYNITRGMLYILSLNTTMGKQRQVLHISVSILTSLLILPFTLLLVTFSCLIFLQLMRLTTTKNQGILIWSWIISGLLSVVNYGYVRPFLW